jgi:hypothetical protein
MVARISEPVSQQRKVLAERVHRVREEPIESMREVALTSARDLKSLKAPVGAFARSGVKFATASRHAIQSLIELESEIITPALTTAAMRLERAAEAEHIVDLVLDPAEILGGQRARFVDEAARAVEVFEVAGHDVRKPGIHSYGQVFVKAEEELRKAETRRAQKTRRTVRKSTTRVRKTAP